MPEGRLQRTRDLYRPAAKDGYCACGLRAEEGTELCGCCRRMLVAMQDTPMEPDEETPWAV